jgi:alkanesulfonate monooxygenase SsuD/methylene tetrahydromethanopterin reductase-like flavin-dependent oxidoreductase (luciferase family)
LLRYLIHQHTGVDMHQAQHHLHQLEAREQLWFGTPDDIIRWIERYEAHVDSRHFVFWVDCGEMKAVLVRQSMELLEREVMGYFSERAKEKA